MSTEKGELVGITRVQLLDAYHKADPDVDEYGRQKCNITGYAIEAVALAAQKALIRTVWSARFLGQSWESSIEEMMLQLGETPYHFPKGTLKEKTE